MNAMKILCFDPYGSFPCQGTGKDPHQENSYFPLSMKISAEIAKNEAIRMALLAIGEQEKENKKNRHRFKLLNQKQVKVFLSQLRNVQLDFRKLRGDKDHHKKDKDRDPRKRKEEDSEHCSKVKITGKKKIHLGTAASQAIAAAAEAWVIARNKGVLEMTFSLFQKKDDE